MQQIWKTQQWPQDWKRAVFIPILKKGNAKECPNYHIIALISHASKVMLKIPKAGFNTTWIKNSQMFKLDLEKAKEPEIKLPTSAGSLKKQDNCRKTSTSASLMTLKPLTEWIATNGGKFWKRWEYQTTWPASWETCMQVKRQQLELVMKQQTGFKLGKEYNKAVHCHPACLMYMQSTSCKMPDGIKHKLESRLLGEMPITSDMQMTSPLWQKAKRN